MDCSHGRKRSETRGFFAWPRQEPRNVIVPSPLPGATGRNVSTIRRRIQVVRKETIQRVVDYFASTAIDPVSQMKTVLPVFKSTNASTPYFAAFSNDFSPGFRAYSEYAWLQRRPLFA
jgi:hypothetical protein